MKLTVTSEYLWKLQEVFNPVVFENEEGEQISVCQRDGAFEINVIAEKTSNLPRALVTVIHH